MSLNPEGQPKIEKLSVEEEARLIVNLKTPGVLDIALSKLDSNELEQVIRSLKTVLVNFSNDSEPDLIVPKTPSRTEK